MTRSERRALAFYVKYRYANPSLGNVLAFNLHVVLYWLVMQAIGIALIVFMPRWWAFLFLGAMLGALLRDLRRMHSVARQWPTQRELLNWDEVERRLAGTSAMPPQAIA